jgi:FixJ family two-component response regulator
MTSLTQRAIILEGDVAAGRGLDRLIRSVGIATDTFTSAADFLASGRAADPGCLVIDLPLPGVDGLELQREIAQAGHTMPVIFISGNANVPEIVEALKMGAVDFIPKPFHKAQLLAAVFQALHKDRQIRSRRLELRCRLDRFHLLTPREREVCQCVAAGLLNKQIGFQLGVSEKTVKIHRGRVMEKLGVRSVPELVRFFDSVVPKSYTEGA